MEGTMMFLAMNIVTIIATGVISLIYNAMTGDGIGAISGVIMLFIMLFLPHFIFISIFFLWRWNSIQKNNY